MTQEEIHEEWRKCAESFDYWRDNYLTRRRTLQDWQEVVKQMSNDFDISLSRALSMYKEDRQKWVDWYNENTLKTIGL